MKSYDETISAVFDRIRTNEIEKQRKRKMAAKLITSLGCLCLVVAVCVGVWGVDSDPEIREYVIYSSLLSSSSGNSDTSKYETYKDNLPENISISNEPVLQFVQSTVTNYQNDKAARAKTFYIGDMKFDLTYSKSCEKPIASTEIGQKCSIGKFDEYSVDRSIVSFKEGTNDLVFYSASIRTIDRHAEGNFTMDEAKKFAESLLKDLYGEKNLNTYTFEAVNMFDTSAECGYAVLYVKYVHGVKTEDEILVKYNMKGELTSINAMQMGYYDQAEKNLKKSDIEAAEKALRESLNETYETSETPTLVLSNTGEYYLWIMGVSSTDQSQGGMFYINIE